MRSSSTQQKPTQRTQPAAIVQLICPVEQPVVCRPVHAVRLLRIIHAVIASELPPDSWARSIGLSESLRGWTIKAALRKTLDGTSYRAAGSECGVDYRDLHKNAKRIGLDRAHLEAWRDYWGPAIAPAWKHHLRRLDDDLDVAG